MDKVQELLDGITDRFRPGALIAAGAAVVALIVIVIVVVAGDDGPRRAEPEAADLAKIEIAAKQAGFPVYFAGELDGHQFELSRTKDGSVYVRYIPDGTQIGDPRPDFLTVGSYQVMNAAKELRKQAKKSNAKVEKLEGGAIAYENPATPTSAYFTYEDADFEVEVYDPEPGRALEMIRAGEIQPVS